MYSSTFYLCPFTCLFLDVPDATKQSTYGSPYHVHPYPSPVRLQHAFQSNNLANTSPKMFFPKGIKYDGRTYSTPTDSPILGRALCLTPRGSPVPGRISRLSDKFQDAITLNSDTETLVGKISAMFPTVSETHIRILMKKYYNREAVVISALQVEKHPIATPGPLTSSPSAARFQKGAMAVHAATTMSKGHVNDSNHITPLTGTPQGSPLLRPASGASSYFGTTRSIDSQLTTRHSPKMKLKYLKSVFPKAEETIILDILANKDNNVQKASEELTGLGFTKKETNFKTQPNKKEKPVQQPIKVISIVKSTDDKTKVKEDYLKKYAGIAERVVLMALESVDYNEDRADQILSAVLLEDASTQMIHKSTVQPQDRLSEQPKRYVICDSTVDDPAVITQKNGSTQVPAVRRLKLWADRLKPILKGSKSESKHKSNFKTATCGPNPDLYNGPKEELLLEEYTPWNGPNPENRSGKVTRAEGPEPRQKRTSLAKGPAPGLAKGSAGLAKGSIYPTKKTLKATFF